MEIGASHRRILARGMLVAGLVVLVLAALLGPERVVRHHFRGHATTEILEETRVARIALATVGGLLVVGGLVAGRRLRRRATARLLVAVSTVLVPLVVVDRVLRPFFERGTTLYVADPELGWRHRPGAVDTYWGMRFRINPEGLRGPERARPKPADVRRVLVLGDSVVFGLGLEDDDDTLPALLERELGTRGVAIECVNAGVCGWSPWQEQRWLTREGAGYEPDLVVLGFVINDVTERFQLERFGGGTRGAQLEYSGSSGAPGWLAESGILLALSDLRRRRALADEERLTAYHAMLEPLFPAVEEGWRHVSAELEAIRDWCRSRDVPLLLVAFPYALQLLQPGLDAPQLRLADEARRLGVPLVDLAPLLGRTVSAGTPVEQLFLDGVHPTAAGNALAAAGIARAVAEARLLGP